MQIDGLYGILNNKKNALNASSLDLVYKKPIELSNSKLKTEQLLLNSLYFILTCKKI